jgi:curli biogenesis system outer membrane secretion channel CsgG
MKRIALAFILGATTAAGASAQAQDAFKPTIAIADVAVAPGGWTLPPPQMGDAIIELLVGELVTSQQFHVYDGQWLVPLQEAGGHVNLSHLRAAAAERHVDYLVLGSVTAFSMVQTGRKAGGLLPLHSAAGGGGYSTSRSQLAVDVNFRIVDVRTGEILTTARGEGTGSRKSTGLGLLGFVRGIPLPILAGAAHTVANARDAMLDEALKRAVHDAALAIAASAPRLQIATVPIR